MIESYSIFMSSTIDQYREAKAQFMKLRAEAKKDLLKRFQELANELLLIQQELAEDFDHKVTLPAKGKKPKKHAAATPAPTPVRGSAPTPAKAPPPPARSVPAPVRNSSPKDAPLFAVKDDLSAEEANILKHIEKNKKKLSEAQAAGKPTKPIEDRLYELEDELHLVQSK
jgi:hypothetical protein